MIIHLKKTITEELASKLSKKVKASFFHNGEQFVLVNSSSQKDYPSSIRPYIEDFFIFESDLQLGSKKYLEKRRVSLNGISIGDENSIIIIGGPCSVESREQIEAVGHHLQKQGRKFIRGGCFKPRTSPYSFQGLGQEGLELLVETGKTNNLLTVTEVKDSSHVDFVIEQADIVQIGAKAMYDQSILRACGKTQKPILLKRGFGTTLQEFAQAAEFILSEGNPNVMLCERGIRTFETKTRFTLDLCGVAWLKEYTNLPIIVDPSHALGYRYGIKDLSRAAVAMGIDGLLIESHPEPTKALSDAAQQLTLEEFDELVENITPICNAMGQTLI